MYYIGVYVLIVFVGKLNNYFLIGKKFKILIFYKKVLKFNIKIKMVCIFRIYIYKIVNEFFMCFFCR